MLGQALARNLSRRCEQRQCDRQVEARALLLQLCRREIDGRFVTGPFELGGLDAAAYALFRLLARAVDEPDERERRHAALDVRLDLDAARLEADEGERDRACKHASTLAAALQRHCDEREPDARACEPSAQAVRPRAQPRAGRQRLGTQERRRKKLVPRRELDPLTRQPEDDPAIDGESRHGPSTLPSALARRGRPRRTRPRAGRYGG